MPAEQFEREQPRRVNVFSVVGSYSVDEAVGHVSLLGREMDVKYDDAVDVCHMRPPLEIGQSPTEGGGGYGNAKAHVVGWVDDLNQDEVAAMRTWQTDVKTRTPPALGLTGMLTQYVIHPPVEPVKDVVSGRVRYLKFSCAGFVLECYEKGASIELLDWKTNDLPEVSLHMIKQIYGPAAAMYERFGDKLGVPGVGPWRIVLAGYVMHSLSRAATQLREAPHKPQSVSEAMFP